MRSIKLLRSYIDLGCRNVLFQIPYQNDSQFKAHFMKLAEIDVDMKIYRIGMPLKDRNVVFMHLCLPECILIISSFPFLFCV